MPVDSNTFNQDLAKTFSKGLKDFIEEQVLLDYLSKPDVFLRSILNSIEAEMNAGKDDYKDFSQKSEIPLETLHAFAQEIENKLNPPPPPQLRRLSNTSLRNKEQYLN